MPDFILPDIVTHRSAITAADSTNIVANWSDAPVKAFTPMGMYKGFRIYPSISGGTVQSFKLRILPDNAGTNPFSAYAIVADFTEPIFVPNMNGYVTLWVKLEEIIVASGTPAITLKLQATNS